jgi:hypothetical protein
MAGKDRDTETVALRALNRRMSEADLISEDTAIIFCAHKHKMRKDIDMLKKIRGKTFEALSGLQMQDAIKGPAPSVPQTTI